MDDYVLFTVTDSVDCCPASLGPLNVIDIAGLEISDQVGRMFGTNHRQVQGLTVVAQ